MAKVIFSVYDVNRPAGTQGYRPGSTIRYSESAWPDRDFQAFLQVHFHNLFIGEEDERQSREYPKGAVVDSPLGKKQVDSEGAAISGVRMDVSRAYAGVPGLLQKVINDNDAAAWTEITNKIDYIYDNLDYSLAGLDRETGFAGEVQAQIRSGKKLLFKPNLVGPTVIDPVTHGEDLGAPICTEWPLMAALMRWFHDKLDLSYHQMALGEASTSTFLLGKHVQ